MAFLGAHFLRDLIVFLFAVAGGFTLSGIIANIYRLAVGKQNPSKSYLYYAVMVVAGPSILIENATRSYRKQDCSDLAYVVVVALVGYWSFVLGLAVLQAIPYL